MTTHILLLLLAGIALLGTFIIPSLIRNKMVSLPIIYVAFGFFIFRLPLDLPLMNPEDARIDRQLMEYITEFIVIVSLAATGLKLDRNPSLKNWSAGLLLLGIAMPLTIAAVAFLGWWWAGLAPATAILLGAVLAPTDPVLAANVQVGPPNEDIPEDDVRFGLTLEAGLNDGLAFPFVYLAIALVDATSVGDTLFKWAWWDFGYRVGMGTLMGIVLGKILAYVFFKFKDKMAEVRETEIESGFFILAATLLTYALTELTEGYGFLAVFVASVVSRRTRTDDMAKEAELESYEAADQVEQAVLGIFLIAFGGIIGTGGLNDLTLNGALIGVFLLLFIRPISGFISFLPSKMPWVEKVAISYFGIRGVGSLYYLAYAHNSEAFPAIDSIWSIVNFTILLSIFLHGLSVGPVMKWVDRKMGRSRE
ncbi:NhaP-type Na+/H+ or K+/H+ antiporter [Lewinella aquimaris]|uniref:NhaP-type Na+/H+ or K+/H+ antiporter n=1 Tax=Neolewinella aquimaris TaxID=1835722 RepID=A0A840E0W1_9BACT|nr:cation:proton antiporter [Neolewinella aquimaris]MBB4077402.1 NhaP-type Na+/H+ or K+/H+ antiporter [Neolewinella aquimaris]